MEGIDAARLAEEMACGHGVESVLGEGVFAGQEFEPIFMNLDHQRIPATADRAIAGGQFWEVTLNLEFNGTAMAAAAILLYGAICHASICEEA